MSSRSPPQTEISFSNEPPGKNNNIDCDERKEEPSFSLIANRLAEDLIPSMNEVDIGGGGKGKAWYRSQTIAVRDREVEDVLYQIHSLATPPRRRSSVIETPTQSPSTNAPPSGKLSAEEESAAEEAKCKLQRLMKILAGNVFWLNCVLLKREDLELYSKAEDKSRQQHVLKLFYLSISLARVLQQVSGAGSLVRSALQLMEEWEYHFSSGTNQSIRGMMAKNTEQFFPFLYSGESTNLDREFPDGPIIPKLHKFSNVVIYGYLLTPYATPLTRFFLKRMVLISVAIELNYIEVILSLCDIMCMIYIKFMDEECYSSIHVFDAVVRVDVKIKHHVLNVTAKRLTSLATDVVHKELLTLKK